MVFWSFSWARLTSGRLNFILPYLRPFSWFYSFFLILFSHLHVASPSFTSSGSVAFVLSPFLHRFSPPLSFCHCAFLWFLAACLPLLGVTSPPVLLSMWSFLPLFQCFGVGASVLFQPQLFCCMAPLNFMFFGFLAVGSSCCHFFSRTKAILFGE